MMTRRGFAYLANNKVVRDKNFGVVTCGSYLCKLNYFCNGRYSNVKTAF
jgi:hypothetical protein